MTHKILSSALLLASIVVGASACDSTPRESYMQWVARDAWDSTCAEQAIVETFKVDNKHWKIPSEVYAADIEAHFKLVNACNSGLPLVGKQYKQFESVGFKGTVEMSHCKKDGVDGWAMPGKESSRCWTGPTLVGK